MATLVAPGPFVREPHCYKTGSDSSYHTMLDGIRSANSLHIFNPDVALQIDVQRLSDRSSSHVA
jgi:hypothetical protein